MLTYRPEIDGLRAVAILLVVFYHAGVPGFGGGFVGVDVFFVISGYLITGLLATELDARGSISFAAFFERRIRRLAPTLVLVLTVTLLLGWRYLSPIGGEQQGLAKSAIATVSIVSNIYFLKTTGGYFDNPAGEQPLLHAWSLSVEEQFYLVWPFILLLAYRRAQGFGLRPSGALTVTLLAIFVGSWVFCFLLTRTDAQSAFYLTPARAWEFALGGLIFLLLRRFERPRSWGGLLAAAGLMVIGLSVQWIDASMPFPGAWALLPVIGSGAAILGSQLSPEAISTRLLAVRPLVLLGGISYAWYLWHWPLLTIARIRGLGELDRADALWWCTLSLILAWLTYRYLEEPIRRKRYPLMGTRRRTYSVGFIGFGGVIVLAGSIGLWAKYGWYQVPENAAQSQAVNRMQKVRIACGQGSPYVGSLSDAADCTLPTGSSVPPRVVVWGDSHAAHLVPLIQDFLAPQGARLRIRYMPQCPPLLGFAPEKIGIQGTLGCAEFNRDVLKEIRALIQAGPLAVVLGARWTGYMEAASLHLGVTGALNLIEHGLSDTLNALDVPGVRVLIMAPGPDFTYPVPACLLRRSIEACRVARDLAEERRGAAKALIDEAGKRENVRVIDPFETFCDVKDCQPQIADTVLFSDTHHFSVEGSKALLPRALAGLNWMIDQ